MAARKSLYREDRRGGAENAENMGDSLSAPRVLSAYSAVKSFLPQAESKNLVLRFSGI
jgi:hypothetical protein